MKPIDRTVSRLITPLALTLAIGITAVTLGVYGF